MENFFIGHMGVKYGVKKGLIQKSTISLKMVQNLKIKFFTRFWKKEFVTLWSSSWGCKLGSHETPTLGFYSVQKPLNHIMSYTFFSWVACRESNSHHFGPFPDEEYSIFALGHFWPLIWPTYGHEKKISITFIFLFFHVDFEKRNSFAAFSHPKWSFEGFFAKRLLVKFEKII